MTTWLLCSGDPRLRGYPWKYSPTRRSRHIGRFRPAEIGQRVAARSITLRIIGRDHTSPRPGPLRQAEDVTGRDGWQADVLAAVDRYDVEVGPAYDEVFAQVHDRITATGTAGKADIATIAFWKRSAQGTWAGKLLKVADHDVRIVTATAFAAGTDAEALHALAELPGFQRQEAISTALLCAADPHGYAVMDRRARNALDMLGLGVGTSRGMTLRYLERIRSIRDELTCERPNLGARDVDKALYILGKSL